MLSLSDTDSIADAVIELSGSCERPEDRLPKDDTTRSNGLGIRSNDATRNGDFGNVKSQGIEVENGVLTTDTRSDTNVGQVAFLTVDIDNDG
jgi:hypothetical protein